MMISPDRRRLAAIGAVLVVGTFVIYLQVRDFQFLAYDDYHYIQGNPHVEGGLSGDAIAWAFTATHASNWHPITWLSHMVDVEVFGLDAGKHHLVNVVLHAVNAVLLLFLLFQMTGSPWKSGFAAALFAMHPLHVESVAWVSQRKDVLCALFCLLSLRAYVGYATRGGIGRYLGSLAFFVLALLSKPMAVTLPLVFLLLEFWPLGRLGTVPPENGELTRPIVPVRRLLAGKIPFFLLSVLSCIVTYAAQSSGGAVNSLFLVPMGVRFSNALLAYAQYLGKTIWPTSLSAFYPHPWEARGGIPLWEVASAFLVVAGISVLSIRRLKTKPYLAVGWFWYLVMLVPVIGIVAVGRQAMADRYTYMPLIGIFVAAAWGVPDLLGGWQHGRSVLIAGGCAVLLGFVVVSRNQASYWHDDIALFGHAAKIDPENAFAQNSVGSALLRKGRPLEAIAWFKQALSGRYSSFTSDALNNLGFAYCDLGQFDKAADCFRRGLAIGWEAHKFRASLSEMYYLQGKIDDAIREMHEAVRLDPGNRNTLRRLEEMESHRGRKSDGL